MMDNNKVWKELLLPKILKSVIAKVKCHLREILRSTVLDTKKKFQKLNNAKRIKKSYIQNFEKRSKKIWKFPSSEIKRITYKNSLENIWHWPIAENEEIHRQNSKTSRNMPPPTKFPSP